MIRRVNLFAGPGAGKSTYAAYLFSQFKLERRNVELISEYVKSWAYEGRKILDFDQLYISAHQMRREYLTLDNGVDFIITDSPVRLGVCYAKRSGSKIAECLEIILEEFDEKYPSLNIFMNRGVNYSTKGRYESLDQAKEMDELIKNYLRESSIPFTEFEYLQNQPLFEFVKNQVNASCTAS